MKMRNILAATVLAGAALTPLMAQSMSSATYVMKAGAGDLYERESSALVLKSTGNPALKSFAQMMVTDHSKSTAAVKAAAMKAKLHPGAPHLMPEQARNIAALRAAHGTDRDTLYITQQKAAHQDALALHQDEAANGRAPSLKMAAAKIVPVVQHHIEMLDAM